MATLTELYEKRGKLVTDARAATDEITKNTDDSRVAELEARSDKYFAELDQLDKEIAREERMAAAEKAEEERRAKQRPTGKDVEERANGGDYEDDAKSEDQVQTEYRDAFTALMRNGFELDGLSSEQRTLLRKGHQELRVQTAGANAAGGYTVPREMAKQIVQSMKDWGPMYDPDIVTEIMTSSGNPFDVPTNDDTGNTSTGAHTEGNEPADNNSGDVVFGQTNLSAYVDITPWVKVSFELMQDSAFNLEAFISGLLGERLGRRANSKLTVGTGVSQANGIVTASALGKTTAIGTALTGDELIDLQHSVNAAYRRSPKCRWMFADTILAAVRKLKDGQGNYLWQMGDVRVGAPDLILGKPYSVNDDVPAIATGNRAVLFGDFSRYWVRKVGNPLIGKAQEKFWPNVGLAGLVRYDGELVDSAAIKHLRMA